MLISIDFELEAPEVELGKSVNGKFIWQGSTARKSTAIAVSVEWLTKGKGSQDRETVCSQIFHNVEPDILIPFEIDLPTNAPPTYSGKLIRIMWQVTITAYVRGFLGKLVNPKEEFSKPIKVLPFH